MALVGPNGSGKTTLLETMLDRREHDGGSVRLGHGVEAAYFSQQDVNTILGVTEPREPATSSAPGAVDPATAQAERADRIARSMAALVAAGADPDDVRSLAAQTWHAGWVTGWDQRGAPGAGFSRNPYDAEQS